MRLTRVVMLLLIGLACLQAATFAPLLPDRVASHFGDGGRADGWASKTEFLVTNLAMVGGMALLFLVLPPLLAKVPPAWINLPNKEYWLADERRAVTLEQIARQMEWLGAATLALLLGITQLSIEANLAGAGALASGTFWLLFGGYMAYVAVWTVMLLRRWYAKPPRRDDVP